ncbi:MAG: SDR family oxidoreductase [Candidatus Latescibacteria bacterium]|jgi:3-oxoacyl-[acyl-carrier protein] reductase|nr:SDR family oxidoreductase [Candidatus Latescibacterota bacterium]
MNLGLSERVAIVGGASKGLGRACAERLAHEGANLVICARDESSLSAAAGEIAGATGREILAVAADWSKESDIERTVEQAMSTFGRVDVLIHNTGGPAPGTFFDHDDEAWREAGELLLFSAIRLYRLIVPLMKRNEWGRIVNITSVTVKEPIDNLVLSNVYRAGIVSLAKSISRELARDNILINTVCPGYYLTQRMEEVLMNQAARSGRSFEEVVAGLTDDIPVGRMGDPGELANLVAFYASEASSNMTGTAVAADGGLLKSLI